MLPQHFPAVFVEMINIPSWLVWAVCDPYGPIGTRYRNRRLILWERHYRQHVACPVVMFLDICFQFSRTGNQFLFPHGWSYDRHPTHPWKLHKGRFCGHVLHKIHHWKRRHVGPFRRLHIVDNGRNLVRLRYGHCWKHLLIHQISA